MLVRGNCNREIVVTYHSGNGADKENDTCDTCCEQGDGSTSKTQADKDVGSVVDDSVNARPLLEEHNEPSSADSLEVVHRLEAHDVLSNLLHESVLVLLGKMREIPGENLLLENSLGLDLEVLNLD